MGFAHGLCPWALPMGLAHGLCPWAGTAQIFNQISYRLLLTAGIFNYIYYRLPLAVVINIAALHGYLRTI